jgi:phosphomannomutase
MGYQKGEIGQRPWGNWQVDEVGDDFVKKTIRVKPGASLSLQSHEHRSEKWEIAEGVAEATVGEVVRVCVVGDIVEIPKKAVHRLKNVGVETLVIKETQRGSVLDESDIVRYDDLYGRHRKKESGTIFVADMDGTLTPARSPMSAEFAEILENFIENHVFYIVSGSDFQKIKEQIPENIRNKVAGIYSSMGNELYVGEHLIYQNNFTPEASLIEKLEEYRKNTSYEKELYPNYIEERCGMINFSVLGRNCPGSARVLYKSWDDGHGERKAIAEELSALYPQYDISLGGSISIDIVLRGLGKDQIADRLRKEYKTEKIIFFGDRTEKGGNDYALAERLLELGNSRIVAVTDPGDVLKFLREYHG